MDEKAKNLNEAIAILNRGRTPAIQLESIPPAPQAVQSLYTKAHEENAGISLLASVEYESISGNMKSRDILIRRVIKTGDKYYLDAIAMDIKAPRLIPVLHIKKIQGIASGRIYEDPMKFIQERLGVQIETQENQKGTAVETPTEKNDFSQVVERTGHEMAVLMYLVAIDGKRNKEEREKVFKYIKERTRDLTYTDADLDEYLISLAPDEENLQPALAKVLSKDQEVIQKFVEAILDIIMADGKIDDRERNFLIRIMDLLEQDGYEISLPI